MKTLLAVLLLTLSTQAKAFMPDPVTWLLHGVGGYVVARVLDKHVTHSQVAGITVASGIGAAKELSDLNFSTPDFLAWGVGAYVYHRTKNMVRCEGGENWYTVYYADTLQECPK